MTRPYPYQPGKYHAATHKLPGTETFYTLAKKRYKFTGLGSWVVRLMRSKPFLSVHAASAAVDLGYGNTGKGRQTALDACQWFVEHNYKLGICAIHDYAANPPRGWRCDTGHWTTYANGELGPGGKWLHIEIEPHMANMPAAQYAAIWRSLPKP